MRKYLPFIFILLMAGFSIQFIGCAPSKPKTGETAAASDEDDLGEIERLLGITEEDRAPRKQQTKDDDDLLTLLKADDDKGTASGADATTASTATEISGDPRLKHLQQQVSDLESQLVEKNRTIADLKAQLMMKEEELKSYRSGKAQQAATSVSPQYSAPVQSSSTATSEYERTYNRGLDLFHSAQYQAAIDAFESLLAQDRNHSLADNAQYWIGECNYALGNYRAAILAFEKVFTFPQSNKNDYAQYKLGLCYYKLGDYPRAKEEFQNLMDNYSNPELIDRAQDYLAQLEAR